MRYAIIENDIVTNVIEASSEWALANPTAIQSNEAGIDWTYASGAFIPPPEPPSLPPLLAPEPTLAELQAQLATLTAQMARLTDKQ